MDKGIEKLMLVISMFILSISYSSGQKTAYPVKVFRALQSILGTDTPSGTWSSWSSWSNCSTHCGPGVRTQNRACDGKACLGTRARHHQCDLQPCPSGHPSERARLCSTHDTEDFNSAKYTWEPHYNVSESEVCSLTCRPLGYAFYAVLGDLTDGTPCYQFDKERICIQGSCQVLGCNGVVGSSLSLDSCGVCGGDNSTCRLVSGLFTKQLPAGHNLVTTLPAAACQINITLIRQSKNYLALKEKNGEYFVNGPGGRSKTGLYEGGGGVFRYRRGGGRIKDTLLAKGPLESPVDLELVTSEANLGVEYRYLFPLSEAQALDGKQTELMAVRTRHGHRYKWSLKALTQCTRTCGGGFQTTVAVCVKKPSEKVVPEHHCSRKHKPVPRSVRCARTPCPAQWHPGEWSSCSASCAQERRILCKQELTQTLTIIVAEGACMKSHNYPTIRSCERHMCKASGIQQVLSTQPALKRNKIYQQPQHTSDNFYSNYLAKKRISSGEVTLKERYPGHVKANERLSDHVRDKERFPGHVMAKDRFPDQKRDTVTLRYPVDSPSKKVVLADWAAQAWGPCSLTCGSGVKERRVHCVDRRGGLVTDTRCEAMARPESEQFCHMGPCTTNTWLVSAWSQTCNAHCGSGQLIRKVHCIGNCEESKKPLDTKPCQSNKQCKGEWFTGRWSICSHDCGEGEQRREVLCTERKEGITVIVGEESCVERRRPRSERRCNIQTCKPGWFTSQWSKCSVSCGRGIQKRDVVCLDEKEYRNDCSEGSRPVASQECSVNDCDEQENNGDGQNNREDNLEEEGEEEDVMDEDGIADEECIESQCGDSVDIDTTIASIMTPSSTTSTYNAASSELIGKHIDSSRDSVKQRPILSNDVIVSKPVKSIKGKGCMDRFKNCNIVVQSRLCRYTFYQNNCCRSCQLNTGRP